MPLLFKSHSFIFSSLWLSSVVSVVCCRLWEGQRPVGELNLQTGIDLFPYAHKAIRLSTLCTPLGDILLRQKETQACPALQCSSHNPRFSLCTCCSYHLRSRGSEGFQFCGSKERHFGYFLAEVTEECCSIVLWPWAVPCDLDLVLFSIIEMIAVEPKSCFYEDQVR
jgi:hypothetical protein